MDNTPAHATIAAGGNTSHSSGEAVVMFEIGRDYRIYTGLGEYEGSSVFTVLAYEAPLLKVDGAGIETIFNTSSPSFVQAEKIRRLDEIEPNEFDEF